MKRSMNSFSRGCHKSWNDAPDSRVGQIDPCAPPNSSDAGVIILIGIFITEVLAAWNDTLVLVEGRT